MKGKTHQKVIEYFRITEMEDWRLVRASDLLSIPGIGKGYLNRLRKWLAERGECLRDDNPPSYWLEALDPESPDPIGDCPFTILVDTNETLPWLFRSIDDNNGNPINVPTELKALWPMGLGDYTIKGMEEDIQIERKSLEDLVGTLGGRRESFEEEISRLDSLCSFAAIVIESTLAELIRDTHDHGARAKSVMSTMVSWCVRYPGVHWVWCAGRNHAEQTAFQLMRRFWWQSQRQETATRVMREFKEMFKKV